ncbi:M20/M25/M40 family metallo-hydrolase [Paenibacillus aquistagni]|uniref:M20/M25/M40 family metallo-hydrolase n=1 Tax=Paenibacillus aquistagni TaxID=1852522 RepID=UPI000B512BA0|nr:M20/M25/M40 family metallo-hydrolase [Paenibacillus aquistagni]
MRKSVQRSRDNSTKDWKSSIIVVLICILFVLSTLYAEQPPSPKGNDAPELEFSAERAMKHVRAIAQEPHPSGSAANERVRDYVHDQMLALGLSPSIATSPHTIDMNDEEKRIDLHNIIGKIKGTEPGKALMLTAHYDSTPYGPGANDDAVGVAALLETARVLQAGSPLERDIWFVITDGEEMGLLGARAFWQDSFTREEIGLVVNFEARGASGPSVLFQTSGHNGALIANFASAAVAPVSSSLLGDLYKTMPNDTDLTVALEAGLPGLNFAYIEDWDKYHSAEDTPEYVSLSTLQHHGENALEMAKRFGSMDLSQLQEPDRIYFNWYQHLVHYPASWVVPTTIVLVLIWLLLAGAWWKRGGVAPSRLALAISGVLGSMLVSVVLSFCLYLGITSVANAIMAEEIHSSAIPVQANVVFIAVALIVHLFVTRIIRYRVNSLEWMLAGMLYYLLLLIVVVNILPGASYLLMLPLIIHSVVIGGMLLTDAPIANLNRIGVLFILAVAPLTLTTSFLHLLYSAMPLQINVFSTLLCTIIITLLQPVCSSLVSSRQDPHIPINPIG